MNSNRFLNKVLYSILFLAFTTLFYSCENFLNSSDVKEAIDKAIYIANSECPVATVEEPLLQDSGLPKNRAIVISFTKAMDPKTFDANFSIEDEKGNNLKDCFLTPEWSNGNKYVKIPANEKHLIDLGNADTMIVQVNLTKGCTTPDKLPITTSIKHKYKINNEIDNRPPEIVSLSAEVPKEYISRKGFDGALILKEGCLPDIKPNATATPEQIAAEKALLTINHINNKFDIYIEGNDYGGGKVQGHVKYRQLYDSMGVKVSSEEEEVYIPLTKNTEDENYKGEYLVDLSDEKYTDGLYEIKVTVQDAYNLDSTDVKTYNVVRDTIFAYRSNTRFGLSSPLFRNDKSEDYQPKPEDTWYNPNYQKPTVKDIEDSRNDVNFSKLPQDTYYHSTVTGETYFDDYTNYRYFISWGSEINSLTKPVELINPYEDATFNEDEFWCPLQEEYGFHKFAEENEKSNIVMQATIKDGAGNDNYITILYPKKTDFYNYIVSDDEDNPEKKKVELYFEDMTKSDYTKIVNIPDRQIRPIYRVFYGKIEHDKQTTLTRNTAVAMELDPWSDISDLHTIKNLDPDSTYTVCIQIEYKTFSVLSGQWVGETYGPLHELTVDTSISGSPILQEPQFTWKKESAGINTGLFKIEIEITNFEDFDESVNFIPCYSTDDGETWTYYESHINKPDENNKLAFTFLATNPLRAPFETAWAENGAIDWWDEKLDENHKAVGDNTYFEAVTLCKEKFHYPPVTAKVKILAVSYNKEDGSTNETKESTIEPIEFDEGDDNIPPFVTSNITQHDSRLSYDGHFYQFENIVREDEGHLSEYFNYYYAPYQESWGDNLSVMEAEEIEKLPGGTGSYYSSCYKNDTDKTNPIAAYTIDVAIPVNGLPDGKYMFFAKVTDTYGNYSYITLGKAEIGTFKNKMTVEYDHSKRALISTLPIEADEQHFDRNMIHIEDCWNDDDNNHQTEWSSSDGYFQYLNQLQNCYLTTVDGKTALQNDNSKAAPGEFIKFDWDTNTASPVSPRKFRGDCFYRIVMQSFNENYFDGTTGVNRRYGRPYSTLEQLTNDSNYLWVRSVVDDDGGATAYDLCTEETVSNTVYYYIPPIKNKTTGDNFNPDNPYEAPDSEFFLDTEYLKDIQSTFFTATATPRSNKPYLVNVIAAGQDLGDDADEWERRGKLIKSHLYYPGRNNPEYHTYNLFNTFDSSVAAEDMYNSHEKGLVYYVAVVHFADGKTAISNVYTMQGF